MTIPLPHPRQSHLRFWDHFMLMADLGITEAALQDMLFNADFFNALERRHAIEFTGMRWTEK